MSSQKIPAYIRRENVFNIFYSPLEIGVGLSGFGIGFLFVGVVLFFDKGLLAIGNVQ